MYEFDDLSRITDAELAWALDEPTRPCMIGDRIVEDRLLYRVAHEVGSARRQCGLLQLQIARRMGTTPSVISRLERAAGPRPSLTTLERYAEVVDSYLQIRLIPLFTLQVLRVLAEHRS
jgi:ribosome-binding protein aMBF1 (putative translation factor)